MDNKKNGKGNSFPAANGEMDELKRLVKEYRKSEERYKAIVEMAPDAITVTDLEGNVIYASPQTLDIHRYESSGQITGRNALELLGNADSPICLGVDPLLGRILRRTLE